MVKRRQVLPYSKAILSLAPTVFATVVIAAGDNVLAEYRIIGLSFLMIVPGIIYLMMGRHLSHSESLPPQFERLYRLPSETMTSIIARTLYKRTKLSLAVEPDDLEKAVFESMILIALPILVIATSVQANLGTEIPIPDIKSALLGTGSLILALGSFREAIEVYESLTGGDSNVRSKVQGIFEKGIGFGLVGVGFLVAFYDIVYEFSIDLPTTLEYRLIPALIVVLVMLLLVGLGGIARITTIGLYLTSALIVSVGATVIFGQFIGISLMIGMTVFSIVYLS